MSKYKTVYYTYFSMGLNGVFDYRYVYTDDKKAVSNTPSFEFTNSHIVFNRPYSNLVWPFGADGSSWTNRKGWYSAGESGSCGGYKINEGTHKYHSCKADDSYALDWNRCSPYGNDNGTIFRSPFDGKIINVLKSGHNGGYGKYVDIEQTNSSGNKYIFRISHLSSIPSNIYKGRWVRAGYTQIGKIGSTGDSSSSHGHCVLYKNDNGCYSPLQYKLDAR